MSLCFKIAEYHPTHAYDKMIEWNNKFGFPVSYGIISRKGENGYAYLTLVLYVELESDDELAIFLLTHNDILNNRK